MLSRRELRSACDRVHFSEAKLQLFLGFYNFSSMFFTDQNSPVPGYCCQEQHGRGGSHGIERPCRYCGKPDALGLMQKAARGALSAASPWLITVVIK